MAFPLHKLGVDLRRNVAVIRLASGQLVIHSTGPFSPEDVAAISALGTPGWLVDAVLVHDTFAKEGRAAFPDIPYLAPPGFSEMAGVETTPILPAPAVWAQELKVLRIEGAPGYEEHVFFHAPSRTLIVADLALNFGPDEPVWTELMLKVAVGGEHHPGMSRPFRAAIKDEAAFRSSVEKVLAWDFDRVIVGHGDVIESGGKAKVSAALAPAMSN